jgi:hypothetical protein
LLGLGSFQARRRSGCGPIEVCGTAEWRRDGEAEGVCAAGKKGRRRWRSSGDAGVRVRVLGTRAQGVPSCRAAALPWACGPG